MMTSQWNRILFTDVNEAIAYAKEHDLKYVWGWNNCGALNYAPTNDNIKTVLWYEKGKYDARTPKELTDEEKYYAGCDDCSKGGEYRIFFNGIFKTVCCKCIEKYGWWISSDNDILPIISECEGYYLVDGSNIDERNDY